MLTALALALLPALLIRYFLSQTGWATALAYYLVAWFGTIYFLAELTQAHTPVNMATVSSAIAAWQLGTSDQWSLVDRFPREEAESPE